MYLKNVEQNSTSAQLAIKTMILCLCYFLRIVYRSINFKSGDTKIKPY